MISENIDCYTVHDILSYTDNDTKLIMNIVNKQYYVNIDTSDIYVANSVRLTKNKFARGELTIKYDIFMKVCKCCGIDIVQLMINKGANDWNWGLIGACQEENMDIVQLMINNGATECTYCHKSIENHKK